MHEVDNDNHSQVDTTIHAAEVAIVLALESYPACIACKSNIKELTDKLGAVPNVTQHNAYWNAHSWVQNLFSLTAQQVNPSYC